MKVRLRSLTFVALGAGVALALLTWATPAARAEAISGATAPAPAPAPTMIDSGGRRLEVVRIGAGERADAPAAALAVIFESGIGTPSQALRALVPRVGGVALWYLRAGYGNSDSVNPNPGAATEPRTPVEVAAELHRLLEASGLTPPYVLTSTRTDSGLPPAEIKRALNEALLARASESMHLVTVRAGHNIQADDPELVLGAITWVRERVARSNASGRNSP